MWLQPLPPHRSYQGPQEGEVECEGAGVVGQGRKTAKGRHLVEVSIVVGRESIQILWGWRGGTFKATGRIAKLHSGHVYWLSNMKLFIEALVDEEW